MADLFGNNKTVTRQQKLKASKKVTADLTRWAIDYLNANGFKCYRSNNTPSTRIVRTPVEINAFDVTGKPFKVKYESVEIFFKKGNIKETVLDISGYRLADCLHTEIEVKTGKDTLSDEQKQRISDIKSAGGISFVFDNKETFLLQIKPHIIRKNAF